MKTFIISVLVLLASQAQAALSCASHQIQPVFDSSASLTVSFEGGHAFYSTRSCTWLRTGEKCTVHVATYVLQDLLGSTSWNLSKEDGPDQFPQDLKLGRDSASGSYQLATTTGEVLINCILSYNENPKSGLDSCKQLDKSIHSSLEGKHAILATTYTQQTRVGPQQFTSEGVFFIAETDEHSVYHLSKEGGGYRQPDELKLKITSHELHPRACFPSKRCTYKELTVSDLNGKELLKCPTDVQRDVSPF